MANARTMSRAAALASLVLGAACTDTPLQPVQTPPPAALDNRLQVDATVCTQPSEDTTFPVKILFLVDTSDSMGVTDRGATRAKAVTDVITRYAGNPAVQFGVIAFDSKIDILTEGFTNSPDLQAISSRLAQADRLTDYQGVLGAAYAMLSEDMQKTRSSAPADLPRTKYVVVFFSDGTPDPQCSAKGGSPYLICVVPREEWQDAFDPPLDPSLYAELTAGGDYNQPEQIEQKVDQIVALQDFYHVGEVRLHTALLFDPAAAADPLALPFHLDRKASAQIMGTMAMHGQGTFTEFDSASKISFINIHYAAIKSVFTLAGFTASNRNVLAGLTTSAQERDPNLDPTLDTDGDGLGDAEERNLRTCVGPGAGGKCADPTDSDGDGYSDFIEAKNVRSGFDPLDAARPYAGGCAARGDSDGDGLRDCEELALRTDPRLFDSDADRMTDLLEVRAGLDPLDPGDAASDSDRDLARSLDEVKTHTDPLLPDQDGASDTRYGYQVVSTEVLAGDRTCYSLRVDNIRLGTTGSDTTAQKGRNRTLVYFIETQKDRPDYGAMRVACVDTRFVNGAFKSPASGKVTLDDARFVVAARFNPARDCLDLTATSATPDGGVPDGGGG